MSSPSSSRLERALELFCEHQRHGGDPRELLAQNPDLADVLETFFDDSQVPTEPDSRDFPAGFEPVREIGRGGTGVVLEARQTALGRRVALKLLHASFAGNPSAIARFHREAQVLARLDHPSIVRVHAASAIAARPWLAMEYVEGESLAAHLQRLCVEGHHGDSMRRLVAATARVAEALHHAHRHGVIHRDVKPSNILLREDGEVVLGDFGLARSVDAPGLTQTGATAGTPHYMAPERILGSGDACDARSDVFSLGLTLYECLALRRAFDGATAQEVLHRILTEDPPELRRIAPGVPVDLAAIVHKAIEHRPERRYATAAEFADDLRAFLELRPVQARPIGRLRRVVRNLRRHPMRAGLVFAAASGLVFAVILATQLPELRAAERARRNEEIEAEIVLATMARSRDAADDCYRHFRRAMELAPDRAEVVAGLCLAVLTIEGPEAAQRELQRHPGFLATSHARRLQVALLRRQGEADEATRIESGLGEPRDWLELWLTAAPLLADQGDRDALRRADMLLSQAILVAPRPRLWLHLQYAGLQVLLDDRDDRRVVASALLELWPDNPRASAMAGICLLHGDPNRAVELLTRSLDGTANDALTQLNLGIALVQDRRREEGAEAIERAMGLPDLSEAQRVRALQILHILQDYERQTRLAADWLAREPGSVSAKRFVARMESRQGNRERALQLFRECVEAAPEDPEARWDYAFCLELVDDLDEAVKQAATVVRQRPKLRHAHDLLLDLHGMRGDADAGIAELQRWLGVAPDDGATWRRLAEALMARSQDGDLHLALEAAERADYVTAGKDAGALSAHAAVLERLGDEVAAKRLRERAEALAPAPERPR